MITVFSAIIGFLASLLPVMLKVYEKKQDYTHEYELRRLEVEAAKQGIELQTRLEQIRSLIEQNRAIYTHDQSLVGNAFINNLRASVRPIITYTFFGIFCVVKLSALMVAVMSNMPMETWVTLIWDDYTAGIFTTIITFWFGSRLWEKTDIINPSSVPMISLIGKK